MCNFLQPRTRVAHDNRFINYSGVKIRKFSELTQNEPYFFCFVLFCLASRTSSTGHHAKKLGCPFGQPNHYDIEDSISQQSG